MGFKADVNVFGSYRLPKMKFRAPVISTIYDIILLRAGTDRHMVDEHLFALKDTISRSSKIITVSENSRNDLIEEFGISPDNIGVVPCGIDFRANNIVQNSDYIYAKYNLPPKYFLYFGTYRAHKNIEGIIKAYAMLPEYIKKDVSLVITCKNNELMRLCDQLKLSKYVVFTGFIEDKDKFSVYSHALVFVFPSLYEGFGLPILEAMAANVPVITSNVSSMPEVAGNAALLVNPREPAEISVAFQKLYDDRELYNSLIQRGKENIKRYSWDRSADILANHLKLWFN